MTMHRFAVMVCCGLMVIVVSAHSSSAVEVNLANGLTVLLHPVGGAGEVAIVTLFSLGNDHDPPGKCGMAHLLEHLYACSAAGKTKSRTAEQFGRVGRQRPAFDYIKPLYAAWSDRFGGSALVH